MFTGKRISRLLVVLFFLMALLSPACGLAQTSVARETLEPGFNLSEVVDKLVEKNAERADALQKYQGRRTYTLTYNGFPASFHAEMVVDMTYDAPATKQFKIVSQSGSQWMIDRVLKKLLDAEQESMAEENRNGVALNLRNYDFSGLERQDTQDNCSYIVAVQPKVPSKLLYRGKVWVDSKDFSVCRIEAEPAKNPSFWIKKTDIHHTYLKIGDFWLPSENQSVSAIRGGGKAVLTIKYQSYEILAARALKARDFGSAASSLALTRPTN
jgi:outer membrane lipoprotein-sorting protein